MKSIPFPMHIRKPETARRAADCSLRHKSDYPLRDFLEESLQDNRTRQEKFRWLCRLGAQTAELSEDSAAPDNVRRAALDSLGVIQAAIYDFLPGKKATP